ncbi:STAS domain-containing protein [Bacillus alkalicellulosilyticus]|uniref:STAS domain-containing protein n=1 Tax=Alkalihalobacterium alkalicellulosilyticum TaxID=1912214 RepID=UPI000995F006|nr:STAS domain-containing protein [Bacillus alkalicellulosilyticus]
MAKASVEINTIEVENKQVKVVGINGQLVYETAEDVRNTFSTITNEDNGYILNISDVERLDSTGIGVLVTFAKRFGNEKSVVVCSNESIKKLLLIAKLDLLFSIVNTDQEAEQQLKNM